MAPTITTTIAPQGSVNLVDLRYSMSQTRTNFTRVRRDYHRPKDKGPTADFITLVCLICDIYRTYGDELTPVRQFQPSRETQYNKGHTSTISHIEISRLGASRVARGTTTTESELLIVKRPRRSVLEDQSYALVSFITELRVRTYPPLREHPNIAQLRGVGWDFEDEEATIPRPLLLEELAPQGALDNFWKRWNFVRMNFMSKLSICRDIAEGLSALHQCGVVHGDVKPENVLVFPRPGVNEEFMVKLTDFGHSVFEHNRLNALPAFTMLWCAPEATKTASMTFKGMKATDYYSFGLVVLSVMIGRPFYTDFEDVERHKQEDSMLHKAIELVEKEDRENNDSDLEVGVIQTLMQWTIQSNPERRDLGQCIKAMNRYSTIHEHTSNGFNRKPSGDLKPLGPMRIDEMVTIGYQTLSQCGHQLKEHVAAKLAEIASDAKDPRKLAAAWELSVCYFSGFGVPISYELCARWLSVASRGQVAAALTFSKPLHQAMGIKEGPAILSSSRPSTRIKRSPDPIAEQKLPDQDDDEFTANRDLAECEGAGSCLETEERPRSAAQRTHTSSDPPKMPDRVARSIEGGTLEGLAEILDKNPDLLSCRDAEGNTLLLLAAKRGRGDMVSYLITKSGIDVSICDRAGRTILHELASYDQTTVRALVPKLVDKDVDIHLEALPTRSTNEGMMFSSGIRCDPILNSILHGNLALLEVLLESSHAPEVSKPCRVCEAGSRFRRTLAVSLSVFRADAVELLVKHIKTYRGSEDVDLSRIEVWAGQELLPLHKVPFNSVAVAAMDLPESTFRAINYGAESEQFLERTIQFLLTTENDVESLAYSMLGEAVRKNNVEAIRVLLREGRDRGFRDHWWMRGPISSSPLMESMRIGYRETFEAFMNEYPDFFSRSLHVPCWREKCDKKNTSFGRECLEVLFALKKSPTTNSDGPKHFHEVNHVQSALRAIVNAPHQDTFFLKSVLKNADRDLIAISPAVFFSDAILTSSFVLATAIADACPQIWSPVSTSSRPHIAYEDNEQRANAFFLKELWEIHDGRVGTISRVLAEGTYEQCRFVLKHLSRLRSNGVPRFKRYGITKTPPTEDGVPQWARCPLTKKEYLFLLKGNIRQSGAGRAELWDIIEEQIKLGHSTSQEHLCLAIRCMETEAVRQMLSRGWQANGPPRTYFSRPLQLCQDLARKTKDKNFSEFERLFRSLNTDLPQEKWKLSTTHRGVYAEYERQRREHDWKQWSSRLEECRAALGEHGGTIPFPVALLEQLKGTIIAWLLVAYALLYTVVLPPILVYETRGVWTSMTTPQKFGFVYLWATLSSLFPFGFYFPRRRAYMVRSERVGFRTISSLLVAVNHFVLPVLIVRLNWEPFRRCKTIETPGGRTTACTNYSYLVPLPAAAVEAWLTFWFLYF